MTATSKNLTAFSFVTPAATGALTSSLGTIYVAVVVPVTTDVTGLVATFVHTGASVNIDGVAQTSGLTANDFTDDVTYTIVALDATEQDFIVSVRVTQVTPLQLAQVRRMIAEPTTTTYSDALLTSYIEKYPHLDSEGEEPLDENDLANSDWIPTYDIAAAAADIWEEKANLVITRVDFSADGGNYSMSQQFEQMMKQCRYYRAKRMPTTSLLAKSPNEGRRFSLGEEGWIGNLPETD